MILVDIGNSGIKATHLSQNRNVPLTDVVRVIWGPMLMSPASNIESLDALIDQLVLSSPINKCSPISTWMISSVHGSVEQAFVGRIHARCAAATIRRIAHNDVPMELEIDVPEKLGIDRLLAAYAVQMEEKRNGQSDRTKIVIQAGTAVTVDLISKRGVFQGGAIMPGLSLSLKSLSVGTDRLPLIDHESVKSSPELPGKNTSHAIAAGAHASFVGGVQFLIARYRELNRLKWHEPELSVFISGGDGNILQPHIPPPVHCIDHLVLLGLSYLAQQSE